MKKKKRITNIRIKRKEEKEKVSFYFFLLFIADSFGYFSRRTKIGKKSVDGIERKFIFNIILYYLRNAKVTK